MRDVPGRLRPLFARGDRFLLARGLKPNHLTIASLVTSVLSAIAFAIGWLAEGGVLFLLAGLLDVFDGRVARAGGMTTRAGALLDSVCDRWGELLVLGGLAFHARGGLALAAALGAIAGSFLVSYTRARGETLGVRMKDVGFLQRPERILAVGVASLLAPFAGEGLLLGALAAIGAVGSITALVRLRHGLRALREADGAGGEPDVYLPRAPRAKSVGTGITSTSPSRG
jgi:phosphatidylglycerophosphate synthase